MMEFKQMFAVIRTGGKQYKVAKDDVIAVEKLDAKPGDKIELNEVLMLGGEGAPTVGAPLIEGAKVKAEIVDQARTAKIIVFKKRRRQNYRRTKGHRQTQTLLKILDIGGKGKPAAKSAAKPAAKPAAEKPAAKPAAKKTEKTEES